MLNSFRDNLRTVFKRNAAASEQEANPNRGHVRVMLAQPSHKDALASSQESRSAIDDTGRSRRPSSRTALDAGREEREREHKREGGRETHNLQHDRELEAASPLPGLVSGASRINDRDAKLRDLTGDSRESAKESTRDRDLHRERDEPLGPLDPGSAPASQTELEHTSSLLESYDEELQLEILQLQQRNEVLRRDNAKLLQRWLDSVNEAADKMNLANAFYSNLRAVDRISQPGPTATSELGDDIADVTVRQSSPGRKEESGVVRGNGDDAARSSPTTIPELKDDPVAVDIFEELGDKEEVLSRLEQQNRLLVEENAALLQRWLDHMNEAANEMNQASDFYVELHAGGWTSRPGSTATSQLGDNITDVTAEQLLSERKEEGGAERGNEGSAVHTKLPFQSSNSEVEAMDCDSGGRSEVESNGEKMDTNEDTLDRSRLTLDGRKAEYKRRGAMTHDEEVEHHARLEKEPGPQSDVPIGGDGAPVPVHNPELVHEGSSSQISSEEMFQRLVDHGCTDLSSHMDPDQYSSGLVIGGGFGDVWKGKLRDGTEVAIKVWRFASIQHNGTGPMKRAMREIYYWSKTKHQNVQELMGVIIFQGRLGMVSLWMDHGNLRDYIHKFPKADRYSLCVQVVTGVVYLHSCKMVHGDLKAVNILVSRGGIAKLSDFDHSIMAECSLAFSETSQLRGGTTRWMAPELILDDNSRRNEKTDIYALGMTMLEIITGASPYDPECREDHHVIRAVMQKRLPKRHTAYFGNNPRDDQMWELLLWCWSREPTARPSANDVLELLSGLASK